MFKALNVLLFLFDGFFNDGFMLRVHVPALLDVAIPALRDIALPALPALRGAALRLLS